MRLLFTPAKTKLRASKTVQDIGIAGRGWNRGKESVGRPADSVQDVRVGGVEDDVVAAAHHQDSLLNALQGRHRNQDSGFPLLPVPPSVPAQLFR